MTRGRSRLKNTLYVAVPCYNEEEVLRETAKRLKIKLAALMSEGKISEDSRAVFINDGSKDSTWSIIEELCAESDVFAGVTLTGNRGHQNALLAGLMSVKDEADMVVSMDADLQDDIDAIDRMVDKYLDGCDIVYGVRSSRKKDTFFKKLTAEGYYKVLGTLGCKVVFNHADYRLMSARALDALSLYGEQNLFLRGIVPMLGFKSAVVEYERGERFAGESKYPLKKMLAFAADGVASLSLKPLRFITTLGAVILFLAFAFLIFAVVGAVMGHTMLNWKIIVFSVWAVGGLILLSAGILGEYVGRTYMEAKHRPRYFVAKSVGLKNGTGFSADSRGHGHE